MKLNPFPRAGLLAAVLTILFANPSQAELSPEAQAAVKKGVIAAKEQEWQIAIQSFQDARKIAPDAPEVYYNLGLAESRIPGRELRAIAWFGAYLAAVSNASNAAAVDDFISGLQIKNEGNLSRLIKSVQDAAGQTGQNKARDLITVGGLWAEAGDMTAAGEIVDLMPDSSGKESALVRIAEVQVNAADRAGAKQTLASARKFADLVQNPDEYSNYQSQAYNAVAEAQTNAGDLVGAQATAELIKTAYLKCQSQIAIARAQTEAGDVAGAQQTLVSALATSGLIKEASTACDCKIQIAWGFLKTGDLSDARQTLVSAAILAQPDPSHGYGPYSACSNQAKIAQLQAQAADFAAAQTTLVSALRTADLLEARDKSSAYTQIQNAVSCIVRAQIEAGDLAGAQKTLGLVQDPNLKDSSVFYVVEAQAKGGDFAGAKRYADLLREAPWNKYAQDAIAGAQEEAGKTRAKAGDVAGALKIVNSIQTEGIKSRAQEAIATMLTKRGNYSGALQTIESIQDAADKSKAQLDLAGAQVKAGDLLGAQKTADLMQIPLKQFQAQIDIAGAQAKAGDLAGTKTTLASALKTADRIQDTSWVWKSWANAAIVYVQIQAGDLADALTTAERIENMSQKSAAQSALAEAQAKAGDLAGARITLASALRSADLIQDTTKSLAQAAVARGQAKAGDPAGAKETFALALSTAGSKSWAQRAIAKTQAEAGDFAGSQVTFGHALETAGLIQKADDQVSEQQAIAQARAEAGDFAGALNTADLLHEAYLRSKAQAAIAEIQAAAGDRAGAKTTFATALKTADSVKSDENKNSDAHATIAEALARTGDLAGALMIADLVQAADLKYSAQQTVAEAQAAAGDVAGAKATFASALVTANRIERDINRAGAQMDIAKAQVKTGDLAGAQMTADSIQDVTYQGMAQSAIDDAAATTGAAIPRTAASRPRIVVQTPVQPAIPPIKVSSWLDKLDDKTDSADCPLNTEPFLDLAGFLKSLPPSDDPQKVFESLSSLAKKIVKAQNTIGGMLQRQAKQAAKS